MSRMGLGSVIVATVACGLAIGTVGHSQPPQQTAPKKAKRPGSRAKRMTKIGSGPASSRWSEVVGIYNGELPGAPELIGGRRAGLQREGSHANETWEGAPTGTLVLSEEE